MDDAAANPLPSLLPDDVESLKKLCAALREERSAAEQERDVLKQERDRLAAANAKIEGENTRLAAATAKIEDEKAVLTARYAALEAELLRLRRKYYGPRAELLTSPEQLDQLLLGFAGELDSRPVDPEDLFPEDRGEKEPRHLRRGHGRRNLKNFDHLPSRTVEHDLPEPEKACSCCGRTRQRIGAESSWQLEYIPGRFERINHVRHTYACAECEKHAEDPRIITAAVNEREELTHLRAPGFDPPTGARGSG